MADSWNAAGIFPEVSAVCRGLRRYRNWNGNFADSRDLFALELISTKRGIASDDGNANDWQLAREAFCMMNSTSYVLTGEVGIRRRRRRVVRTSVLGV